MPFCFKRSVGALLITCPLMSFPLQADPGVGIGFSYVFGEGAAIGLKVFSDDEEDQGVAEIGIDYVFPSQAWRPHLGAAYLGDDYFVDVNLGYTLGLESWNVAMGAGYTNTDEDKKSTTSDYTPPETETVTDAEVVDTAPETDLDIEGETDLVAKLF